MGPPWLADWGKGSAPARTLVAIIYIESDLSWLERRKKKGVGGLVMGGNSGPGMTMPLKMY